MRGLVQRFEYTLELAWKTLKDRLESDGAKIKPIVTPRNVIRAAYESGLIDDGRAWMDMLEDRNRMSHEYDREAFKEIAYNIHRWHLGVFAKLRELLAEEDSEP